MIRTKWLCAFLFVSSLQLLFAQLPTTTCRIANTNRPAPNQLEFSVYLKNTSAASFEYSGGAFHFDFNKAILNGGTGTMAITATQLGTLVPKNPTVFITSTPGQLRTAAPTPPGSGNGKVIASMDSVLVMKVVVTTTAAALTADSSMIKWRIAPMANPLTKYGAYIATVNTEIQSAGTFLEDGAGTPPVVITWQVPVTVSASASSQALAFGMAPTATNGIDANLGEAALTAPQPGAFDARFNLPVVPAVTSLKDFRRDTLRAAIWNFSFVPGAAGYPVTVKWNRAMLPAAGFFRLVNTTGGIDIDMRADTQLIVTNTAVTELKIEYLKFMCKTFAVTKGWNIVSVPLAAANMNAKAVFPTSVGALFRYQNGYVADTLLVNGKGYWARFDTLQQVEVCGNLVNSTTVPLAEGWNLVGLYDKPVQVAAITTTPAGIINSNFFGFTYLTGYQVPVALTVGNGYWVRASAAGVMNIGGTLAKETPETQNVADANWIRLTVTDNSGASKTLYLSKEQAAGEFSLPPLPPAGIFDIRFATDRSVELFGRQELKVQSSAYPLTIKVEGADITVRDAVNGNIFNQTLRDGKEVVIQNEELNAFSIETAQLPTEYALFQNHPNPFNPTTTIRYQLPENARVVLQVFDILGKQVATLINEQQEAGTYNHQFSMDSYRLASGVYIYRLSAGKYTATKKMMLLR